MIVIIFISCFVGVSTWGLRGLGSFQKRARNTTTDGHSPVTIQVTTHNGDYLMRFINHTISQASTPSISSYIILGMYTVTESVFFNIHICEGSDFTVKDQLINTHFFLFR